MNNPPAPLEHFKALDIRVGRVMSVEEAWTQKPTYRISVAFGGELGTKVSCGGYRHYTPEELLGKLVIAVVNVPPRQMGPEISEILILGAENERGEPIYLTPASDVPLGQPVF